MSNHHHTQALIAEPHEPFAHHVVPLSHLPSNRMACLTPEFFHRQLERKVSVNTVEPIALYTDAQIPPPTRSMWQELRDHWMLLIAVMFGMAFGTPGHSYWFGVLIGPMTHQNGWSLSQISLWSAFGSMAGLLVKPVSGWLSDRFGPRTVLFIGMPLLGLAVASAGLVGANLALFYGAAVLVGIFGTVDVGLYRSVVETFQSSRGLALGIMFSGAALSAEIGPRLTLMVSDRWGIPGGFMLLGLVALVPLPFMYFGMRRRPRPNLTAASAPVLEDGFTPRQAARTPTFWLVIAVTLLHAQATGAILFHVFPFLTASGFSRAAAAGYIGSFGLFLLAGKLTMGFVVDKLPAALVCAGILLAEAAAALMLGLKPSMIGIALPLLGFTSGGGMPCTMYYVPKLFGVRHYGVIVGILASVAAICYAFAPVVFSEIKTFSGGYELPFLIMAIGLTGASAIYLYFGLRRHSPTI